MGWVSEIRAIRKRNRIEKLEKKIARLSIARRDLLSEQHELGAEVERLKGISETSARPRCV